MGFHELGRYLLKPEPAPSYGYCFQSPDRRTIGVLGQMFDSTYFSFDSLFANGMVLETGSVSQPRKLASINDSTMYRVVRLPETTVAEA